jgi:SAM-dependent methyltransferase
VIKKDEDSYLEINKSSWNKRTGIHFESDFYDVKGFLEGASSLKSIETDLLGNIQGKSLLHLQCHFGQDTISLARMGARCIGIDFSEEAISKAKELNATAKTDAQFICSDVYALPENLKGQFDIVFTSYGTIGWLPDLDKWAAVIAHFLKEGGTFVMADFHPALWMLDEQFTHIKYPYFNKASIVEEEKTSYTENKTPLELKSVTWNHSIADILTALISHRITIEVFQEFDYSPYECFEKLIEIEKGKFQIEHLQAMIPMVYAIRGRSLG